MVHGSSSASARKTWFIIIALVVFIFAKGLFSLYVVGDNGQPTWNYRPIDDLPGASPYAVYDALPFPQHVRGEKGE
jgi:hypothetical protein